LRLTNWNFKLEIPPVGNVLLQHPMPSQL